jgi:2-iminobutanoate/2-iminopropanoate deaminase
MPERKVIQPPQAPRPAGAYSPALLVDGWLFLSGQGPVDPVTGGLAGETVEQQTEQVLANIAAVLAGVGATLADVVNATVHLADVGLFERFNGAYAEAFPDPKPARTTVGSMLAEGMLVEIAVIARIGLSG